VVRPLNFLEYPGLGTEFRADPPVLAHLYRARRFFARAGAGPALEASTFARCRRQRHPDSPREVGKV
jgi:hypothetical protein